MGNVPQGSVLGPVPINIFVGGLSTPSTSLLCSAADMLEGRDAIQRDLDRMKTWTNANLLKCTCIRAIPSTSTVAQRMD